MTSAILAFFIGSAILAQVTGALLLGLHRQRADYRSRSLAAGSGKAPAPTARRPGAGGIRKASAPVAGSAHRTGAPAQSAA